jgi:hypothetical protein
MDLSLFNGHLSPVVLEQFGCVHPEGTVVSRPRPTLIRPNQRQRFWSDVQEPFEHFTDQMLSRSQQLSRRVRGDAGLNIL